MALYEKTFEHQHLPFSMEFTSDAITFLRQTDGFVQYYHNYYQEDLHYKSFKEMVHERISLGEIIQHKSLCD